MVNAWEDDGLLIEKEAQVLPVALLREVTHTHTKSHHKPCRSVTTRQRFVSAKPKAGAWCNQAAAQTKGGGIAIPQQVLATCQRQKAPLVLAQTS